MSWRRERGVDDKRECEDKWSGSRGAIELNEGWSKAARVTSALAFLTM